jgi:hypothetical protein
MSLEIPDTPEAAVVEHVLDLGSAHGAFAHKVRHGTRIESARSRSHERAVKRGKAHCCTGAASTMHRADFLLSIAVAQWSKLDAMRR